MQRDSMQYDVVIVGAGPSGLAAAIRLKQQAAAQQREVSVCVLEKASAVGMHILSGAVMPSRSGRTWASTLVAYATSYPSRSRATWTPRATAGSSSTIMMWLAMRRSIGTPLPSAR